MEFELGCVDDDVAVIFIEEGIVADFEADMTESLDIVVRLGMLVDKFEVAEADSFENG